MHSDLKDAMDLFKGPEHIRRFRNQVKNLFKKAFKRAELRRQKTLEILSEILCLIENDEPTPTNGISSRIC